jgi:hypothetical protein
MHVSELCLLEIGSYPDLIGLSYEHQGLARLYSRA